MDPVTAPVVHNLSREKEQPTLKLNNKTIFIIAPSYEICLTCMLEYSHY